MILVDTSVIAAWLDHTHKHHKECLAGIIYWAGRDRLAVSAVTYAELAAGARTREAVDEDLKGFTRVDLDFASAWRAGMAFRQYRPAKRDEPVLPDFFIRAQAAVLNLPHLKCGSVRVRPGQPIHDGVRTILSGRPAANRAGHHEPARADRTSRRLAR